MPSKTDITDGNSLTFDVVGAAVLHAAVGSIQPNSCPRSEAAFSESNNYGVVASWGETPIGVAWAECRGGATSELTLPIVSRHVPTSVDMDAIKCRLLAELSHESLERGNRLAYVLVGLDHGEEADLARAAGLLHVANVLSLRSERTDFPELQPTSTLQFELADGRSNESRFNEVVRATWQGTLDCPCLVASRTVEQVLEGHRHGSKADESRWYIVKKQDQDIGCLLMSGGDVRAASQLRYFGVTPTARGQGLGVEIVRYAQWIARQLNVDHMSLTVDEENAPALAIYAAAGFRPVGHGSLFVASSNSRSLRTLS